MLILSLTVTVLNGNRFGWFLLLLRASSFLFCQAVTMCLREERFLYFRFVFGANATFVIDAGGLNELLHYFASAA